MTSLADWSSNHRNGKCLSHAVVGLLVEGSPSEIELVKDNEITVTTEDEYKDKVTASMLYVDYPNITKVVTVGKRIYVDDGLISLIIKEIIGKKHNVSVLLVDSRFIINTYSYMRSSLSPL